MKEGERKEEGKRGQLKARVPVKCRFPLSFYLPCFRESVQGNRGTWHHENRQTERNIDESGSGHEPASLASLILSFSMKAVSLLLTLTHSQTQSLSPFKPPPPSSPNLRPCPCRCRRLLIGFSSITRASRHASLLFLSLLLCLLLLSQGKLLLLPRAGQTGGTSA